MSALASQDRLRNALDLKPDGVVEMIARDAGVSPRMVLDVLPAGQVVFVGADAFDTVWSALMRWREVLMIVQTGDVVLEVKAPLPAGTSSNGWFNVHGDSPIGGHIRRDACSEIAFVDRPFHGRRSCSIWFLNEEGSALFKLFVPRDGARNLDPAALEAFETLRGSIGIGASG